MMGVLFNGGSSSLLSAPWFGGPIPQSTSSGETVTEEKALTLSSYYACIKVLSEDVAKLPFQLFQEEGTTRERVDSDHPVSQFLLDMNPSTTSQAIRETLTNNAAGWGFGVAEIERDNGGRPVALWPIHPSRVTPRCIMGEIVWDILVDDCDHLGRTPGTTVRLLDEEVFALRGIGGNGMIGYSVLRYGAESIGLSLAAQKFGAAFFGNGATPSIVITHPARLKADAATALRKSWQEAHQGVAKARRPVVIEEGATVEPLTVNPDDGQFLETRQFQVEEICRWFRMPPVKIQHNQNTPYSNIESLDRAYVKDTLMPWLLRWEEEGRRKLILTRERKARYFFDHDVAEQLRGDPKEQAEVERTLIATGVLSINESRNRRRLAPIEGGDAHFMQQGFTTVSAVASGENLSSNNQQPQNNGSSSAVMRPIVASIASRLVSRECAAVARIEKRDESVEEKRTRAVNFFYDHDSVMKDGLSSVVDAWHTLTGSGVAPSVMKFCSEYCASHRDRWAKAVPTAESLTAEIMSVLEP